jgi:hypothetical protein
MAATGRRSARGAGPRWAPGSEAACWRGCGAPGRAGGQSTRDGSGEGAARGWVGAGGPALEELLRRVAASVRGLTSTSGPTQPDVRRPAQVRDRRAFATSLIVIQRGLFRDLLVRTLIQQSQRASSLSQTAASGGDAGTTRMASTATPTQLNPARSRSATRSRAPMAAPYRWPPRGCQLQCERGARGERGARCCRLGWPAGRPPVPRAAGWLRSQLVRPSAAASCPAACCPGWPGGCPVLLPSCVPGAGVGCEPEAARGRRRRACPAGRQLLLGLALPSRARPGRAAGPARSARPPGCGPRAGCGSRLSRLRRCGRRGRPGAGSADLPLCRPCASASGRRRPSAPRVSLACCAARPAGPANLLIMCCPAAAPQQPAAGAARTPPAAGCWPPHGPHAAATAPAHLRARAAGQSSSQAASARARCWGAALQAGLACRVCSVPGAQEALGALVLSSPPGLQGAGCWVLGAGCRVQVGRVVFSRLYFPP